MSLEFFRERRFQRRHPDVFCHRVALTIPCVSSKGKNENMKKGKKRKKEKKKEKKKHGEKKGKQKKEKQRKKQKENKRKTKGR